MGWQVVKEEGDIYLEDRGQFDKLLHGDVKDQKNVGGEKDSILWFFHNDFVQLLIFRYASMEFVAAPDHPHELWLIIGAISHELPVSLILVDFVDEFVVELESYDGLDFWEVVLDADVVYVL